MERLRNEKAWVVLEFDDGTKQTIYTTLNEEILREYGVTLKPHTLFDLNKLKYVKFREDAVQVEIFDCKPEFDKEVLKFAGRFI